MTAHELPDVVLGQVAGLDHGQLSHGSGSACGILRWVSTADGAVPPSGVVTFLFTDVEGSTRRWEADADQMRRDLADHDQVLRNAIEAHGVAVQAHR